jgi:uncharacterized membrane protein YidH (DUF202 family)
VSGSPEPGPQRERGLQRERTALAWDRTGVAFMVVGAFLLRVAGGPYPQLRHLPGAAAIAFGGGLVAGAGRGVGRAGDAAGEPRARPRVVRLVSAALLLVCCASLALVLLAA